MDGRTLLSATLALLTITAVTPAGEAVSYTGEIAAIVRSHCLDCHRRGGAAPFSLVSYRDVASHADQIRQVVASGEMPPWKAIGNHGEFVGDRRLSEDQKRLIDRWIGSGCPEGEREAGVVEPPSGDGWQLGTPDVVIRPMPLGSGSEASILATELDWPADGMVTAIEIRPRHAGFQHALIWLDLPVRAQVMEVDDQGEAIHRPKLLPSWLRERILNPAPSAFRPVERAKAVAARDRRLVGVWAFDCLAQSFGENTGFRFPAGSRLIVETPAIKNDGLAPPLEVGLHFAKEPPKRLAALAAVEALAPTTGLSRGLPCLGSFKVPVDCELQLLAPHADHACQEVRVGLTLPDGRSESLLWIDRWNPRWETTYRYRRPLQVPAGSRIDVRLALDSQALGESATTIRGPMLVAAQLVPVRIADYDELVRAMQRTQMDVARLPVQASRTLR
jgi:hypothetical protein